MRISMNADFRILKNDGNGNFVCLKENEADFIGIGGFSFDIGQYSVPFDLNVFDGNWYKDCYSFSTGRGWFFNDFELHECYDEHYKEIGLKREDISAEFLAAADHIEDFCVDFVFNGEECDVGRCADNACADVKFKLQLLKVGFEDVETGRVYDVDPKVIASFNKGERELSLDSVLVEASNRSNEVVSGVNVKETDREQEIC